LAESLDDSDVIVAHLEQASRSALLLQNFEYFRRQAS